MLKRTMMATLVCLLIISCAPKKIETSYNEEDYKNYVKSGKAVIYGQAFLRQRGGGVVYGAGAEVYLIPVTSYTTEWVKKCLKGPFVRKSTVDSRLQQYIKTTQADGSGNFDFADIPKGDYYVACRITWRVKDTQFIPEGGWIVKRVSVNEGEEFKVMLTK